MERNTHVYRKKSLAFKLDVERIAGDPGSGLLYSGFPPKDHPVPLQRPPTRSVGPCNFDSPRIAYRKTPLLPHIRRPRPVQGQAVLRLPLPHDDLRAEGFSPRQTGGQKVVLRMQRLRPIPPYAPGRRAPGPSERSLSAMLKDSGLECALGAERARGGVQHHPAAGAERGSYF